MSVRGDRTVRTTFARFLGGERGTASAEAVLWLPIFIFLFGLLADTALAFGGQARALRVLQDANRMLSVGRITDVTVAENAIKAGLADLSTNVTVKTEVSDTGVIRSVAIIPVADLTATTLVGVFSDLKMTVVAQHLSEG